MRSHICRPPIRRAVNVEPLARHMIVANRAEDLDEMNIEIMRNTLFKAYLDDFARFCSKLGGATAEVMGSLLAFEVRADVQYVYLLVLSLPAQVLP